MKILVTGGAGFIGSHLTDKLIEQGHQVVIIDNLSTGKRENINSKAKFYELDILSPKLSEVFQEEKPEAVFHLAAQIDVSKSIKNPIQDAEINILGGLNVLENSKRIRAKKVIFISSAGVYGQPETLPIKEDFPLNPLSPYPIAKLAIEKYLHFFQSQGLDFVILRYSNVYGPRQLTEGEGGVIAIFINHFLKEKKPTVFGDGNQSRDFLYVGDAVEAAILALDAQPASVYNVAVNKAITINNLLESINQVLKNKIEPIYSHPRQGEILHSRLDYSKIKKELGWEPKYDLKQGLKKTIEWYCKNF